MPEILAPTMSTSTCDSVARDEPFDYKWESFAE
jgi:hypothetical protein